MSTSVQPWACLRQLLHEGDDGLFRVAIVPGPERLDGLNSRGGAKGQASRRKEHHREHDAQGRNDAMHVHSLSLHVQVGPKKTDHVFQEKLSSVPSYAQRRARPVRHRRRLEIRNRVETHVLRMPLVVQLDGSHERHSVFRASPRLAGMHIAEVGVIGQNDPGQQTPRFALGHGLQELVLDPPRGAVTHAQVPLERERGDVALVLGDQVDGLEQLSQGQLGGVKQRARANRRLRSAVSALPVFAPVGQKRGVCRLAALRADESRRPACPLQGGLALRLGSKSLDELAQRHTRLKLNLVLGHRRILVRGCDEDSAPGAGSGREPAS